MDIPQRTFAQCSPNNYVNSACLPKDASLCFAALSERLIDAIGMHVAIKKESKKNQKGNAVMWLSLPAKALALRTML